MEGAEQNGIQDAEHCSIGANRQRQHRYRVIVNPALFRRVRAA